ncbi:MAG: GWxTD domain-containing protein, partial [Bacteroidota bacterium]
DTTSLQSGQVFVEQVRLAAVPGEYELDIEVSPAGRSQLRLARDLRVPSYNSEFTMVSALQLASGIQQATGGSDALTKSGLTIRPNPDAFYGGNQGAVQYYAEVYGPPAQTDEYTLLTFLAEIDGGAALPGTERRTQRAVKPVDVVASQMDISTLPSGIYYLRFVVLDASNQSAAEQSKRFYVINPDVERPEIGPDLLTYEETLFAAMDSEELQLNIQHALVIASNRERSSLVRPQSDEDRRRALALFWTNRDQDGLPNQNEARRAFYERLGVVNDRYREVGIPAYETDRGRIYLTYGAPVQIERRVFEANMHPHEIWVYDNIPGEGRGQFVFADRFSSDRYELIHSNVSGEVSMPSWRTELMQ